MRLTNLPFSLPDETLYSLAARIRLFNGIRNDRDACLVMFGGDDGILVGDAPVDLERFCNVTGFHYGNALEVSRAATITGFMNRLGCLESRHVHQSEELGGGNSRHVGLVSLSNGQAHVWRWCPVCKSNELREFGVAYWHRVHQLQGVQVCTIHSQQLHEMVIPFRDRQGHFFLPDNAPGSNKTTKTKFSTAAFNILVRMAELAAAALQDYTLTFDSRTFVETLLGALRERGLVCRPGGIRRDALCNELRGHFYALIGISGYGGWLTDFALHRLARDVADPHAKLDAAQRLMLIEWLWGSWALFRKQIEWQEVIEYPAFLDRQRREAEEGTDIKARHRIRDQHRQACKNYLASNPEAHRSDFWQVNYKACRWLTSSDRAWLDKVLPLVRGRHVSQGELF